MIIRHADAARDAAACAAIYAPHVEGSPTSFEDAVPTAAEIATRIESNSATHAWLVAERAQTGEVIGFAYASPHRVRPAYRWAADVSIYVDASAHRGGVGRALYVKLFELLERQRILIAISGITLPNDASVGLHEALGFKRVGVYTDIGYKAGAWRDVAWYQLQIAPPPPGTPPEPLGPQRLPD
jgi:phosphinothricin acetyltransferase